MSNKNPTLNKIKEEFHQIHRLTEFFTAAGIGAEVTRAEICEYPQIYNLDSDTTVESNLILDLSFNDRPTNIDSLESTSLSAKVLYVLSTFAEIKSVLHSVPFGCDA